MLDHPDHDDRSGLAVEGPIRAPELDGAVAWLNVAAPLSLSGLRGKVVLLDFWTYGCINCIHGLPDLARLEAKYRNELVVIGIHAAKFDNERATENIRQVVARYGIEHPVANDAEFKIWGAYTVRAWPTQVLIDPAGYIVAGGSGEGKAEAFDRAIAAVIAVFDQRGELDRAPPSWRINPVAAPAGALAFPGKVLADPARDRLFIADSNHDRVLVTTRRGDPIATFGPASDDDAQVFSRPQGLSLSGDQLYVADTGNHRVRVVDLETARISTVAGTGRQARRGDDGGLAIETALSSPWDLAIRDHLLFVGMAGLHQIWIIDVERGLAFAYAGSGREARQDGSIDESAFAQPSGLALEGDALFVADSESNIIRSVALPPVNRVQTIAGGDLFDFGDRDGTGDAVRLQHPLGLAVADGVVYIADSYNHRIKRLDPSDGSVTTLAGTGEAGHRDGAAARASFYEPGGLSVAGQTLFVADTNNHAVRTVDLETLEVGTLHVA